MHPRTLEGARECWESLPLELQIEILSWLPAKDAVRLRVVCNNWASLLHDPGFRELWRRHKIKSDFLLLQHGATEGTNSIDAGLNQKLPSAAKLRLQYAPPSSNFIPAGWEPICSQGGLILCYFPPKTGQTPSKWFYVGNPVTKNWVQVPAIPILPGLPNRGQMLIPYISEGQMFFKIYIHPYFFDSKLGMWTLPKYAPLFAMQSYNILCIGGVQYGLGYCRRYSAVLLLEVDDVVNFNNSKWLYAWDTSNFAGFRPVGYMVEVGGEIGMLAEHENKLVAMVLVKKSSEEWTWKIASVSPNLPPRAHMLSPALDSRQCATHENRTFINVGKGIFVFDSKSLAWMWLDEEGKDLDFRGRLLVLEPDLTAVPNLNWPSKDLSRYCASTYSGHEILCDTNIRGFSVLRDFKFGRELSWQEVGKVVINSGKVPLYPATRTNH